MKKRKLDKIGVISLAFNEEKTIKKTIEQIAKNIQAEMLVVNDGSTDSTKKIVENLQKAYPNLHLINHIVNIGPQIGIQSGIKYGILLNCNIFVQVDGDGQHSPEQINKILFPILEDEADVVIGSRYLENSSYKTSFTRSTGIKGTSKVISILTGEKITDVSSGFQAFNLKYAKKILELYDTTETLFEFKMKIRNDGLRIHEVPISMKQREFGTSYLSIPRLFLYPFRILYAIIRSIL